MIQPDHSSLSVARQCRLLSISRSSYYHTPVGESAENLALMAEIDRQFLETPFYGVRQMRWHLRARGHGINAKRVRRLMRLMGLTPIYQKPRTSVPAKGHNTPPALALHHQQAAARVKIFLVGFQMFSEVGNAFRKYSHLHLRRTGIVFLDSELLDEFLLPLYGYRHRVLRTSKVHYPEGTDFPSIDFCQCHQPALRHNANDVALADVLERRPAGHR